MKNIFVYYLAIFAPLGLLFGLLKMELIDNWGSLIFFICYVFLYRTLIDGIRLVEKNILKKEEIWKMAIPGSRAKYFKDLYIYK